MSSLGPYSLPRRPPEGRRFGLWAIVLSCTTHAAFAGTLVGLARSAPAAAFLDDLAFELVQLPPEPPPEAAVEPPPEPEIPEPPTPDPPNTEPPPPAPATPEEPPPPEPQPETEPAEAEPPQPAEAEPAEAQPSDSEPPSEPAGAPEEVALAADAPPGEPGDFGVRTGKGGRGTGTGRATGKGSGSGRSNAPRKAAPASAPQIAFADLSQRPTAPGLDALLERNYPPGARLQGRSGTARVALLIGADGRVLSTQLVSATDPDFGEACVRTLRGTRWSTPRDQEGRAVRTILPYECRFRAAR